MLLRRNTVQNVILMGFNGKQNQQNQKYRSVPSNQRHAVPDFEHTIKNRWIPPSITPFCMSSFCA